MIDRVKAAGHVLGTATAAEVRAYGTAVLAARAVGLSAHVAVLRVGEQLAVNQELTEAEAAAVVVSQAANLNVATVTRAVPIHIVAPKGSHDVSRKDRESDGEPSEDEWLRGLG